MLSARPSHVSANTTLTRKSLFSYKDIMSQVLWNNKYVVNEGKFIYQVFFHNCGISKVRDLVSKGNAFLRIEKMFTLKLVPDTSYHPETETLYHFF